MYELKNHVIFIGFMGTGKSTIGRELATVLDVDFIDTDEKIVENELISISELFAKHGEEYFRTVEEIILNESLNTPKPTVIATGGGIILSSHNRKQLKDYCVFLLTASVDEIYQRIAKDEKRPLLNQNEDRRKNIMKILDQRKKFYLETAKYIVDTNNKNKEEITQEIISLLPDCIKKK